MALLIELACNDPNNGQFLGFADFAEIAGIRMQGGRVTVDYSNEQVRSARRHIDGHYTLRVGRIIVPHWHHHSWYGNWCWEAFSVTWPYALKVLNYLAKQRDWHCEEGPQGIYDAINSRKRVTPEEWRERLPA
jgi:hypothetical protein